MSEPDTDASVGMPTHDQPLETTPGNILKDAREAKGLTSFALASSLKVSVKKIEALEADRFDLLPDMVFARALACSICRNLKIDSSPILEQFPPTVAINLKNDESGINAPFRAPQNVSRFRIFHSISRPIALLLIFLLLGALALYASPLIGTSKLESLASGSISKINSSTQIQDKPLALSVLPVEQVTTENSVLTPNYAAINDEFVAAGTEVTTGNIVFKSRSASWVEVVDAKGTVQMRKTLSAGEVVGVSGALPLAVVVGKADSLDVSVAGRHFNLMGVSKDNVARFEVN